jgi:threonine/homoserine/homoserine lactone efflux protein
VLTLALAFLPFAVASSFTPGPNNLMLAASGANFGIRRTVPHILGVVCGFPLLVLAVGLGLGTVFERYPAVHTTLKLVGAAFLVYLAWRIATTSPGAAEGPPGRPFTFMEAALFQWVNPKAWVFAIGAIATFTTVGGPAAREISVILAICAVVAVGSTLTWTVFGVGLSRILRESPRMHRAFNVTMAVILVLSVVPMVI